MQMRRSSCNWHGTRRFDFDCDAVSDNSSLICLWQRKCSDLQEQLRQARADLASKDERLGEAAQQLQHAQRDAQACFHGLDCENA